MTDQDEKPRALLPCPFCGGPAKEVVGLVGCEPCAIGRRNAASWNRRAPSNVETMRVSRAAMQNYLTDHPHSKPHDCYATGPVTGNAIYDLIRCPGCTAESEMTAAIAKIDAALASPAPEAEPVADDIWDDATNAVCQAMREALEKALALHFASDKQPCMSGDPRDRLNTQQRRKLGDAVEDVLAALASPAPEAEPVATDWKDDPAADERWNAGADFAMSQLCAVLEIDPAAVNWDAATETLEGDVQSVLWKILRARLGEDWPEDPVSARQIKAEERGPRVSLDMEGMTIDWPRAVSLNLDADGIGYAIFRDGGWAAGQHSIIKNPSGAIEEMAAAIDKARSLPDNTEGE